MKRIVTKRRKMFQFGRVAMRYYPDKGYRNAVRLLREELEMTQGLMPALEKHGYRKGQRILSPRQMMVIESFLGKPN